MEYNKKLIDAVNALQGDLTKSFMWRGDELFVVIRDGSYLALGHHTYKQDKLICTIEEFNQCVEEMKNSDGVVALGQYSSFKQPLTKENSDYSFYGVKSVVKVEYVLIEDFSFDLKGDLRVGVCIVAEMITPLSLLRMMLHITRKKKTFTAKSKLRFHQSKSRLMSWLIGIAWRI